METGRGTILRRIIILKTRGYSNNGRLNIRSDADEFSLLVAIPNESIERSNTRNGERRRSAHAGARGRLAIGGQMKTGGRFEKVDQLRDKFETFFANEIFEGGKFSLKSDLAITG